MIIYNKEKLPKNKYALKNVMRIVDKAEKLGWKQCWVVSEQELHFYPVVEQSCDDYIIVKPSNKAWDMHHMVQAIGDKTLDDNVIELSGIFPLISVELYKKLQIVAWGKDH